MSVHMCLCVYPPTHIYEEIPLQNFLTKKVHNKFLAIVQKMEKITPKAVFSLCIRNIQAEAS